MDPRFRGDDEQELSVSDLTSSAAAHSAPLPAHETESAAIANRVANGMRHLAAKMGIATLNPSYGHGFVHQDIRVKMLS